MNVIISNKKEALLNTVEIDVQERITGEFTVEDISNKYKNQFFNKLIIDITAIKDYENIATIQSLALLFSTEKLILLLDDSKKVNDPLYLSQLVSMGIYNFTNNISEIAYLVDNPNEYKDVASYQKLGMSPDEIANSVDAQNKANSFVGQRIIGLVNLTPSAGATTLCYQMTKHLQKLYKASGVELNKTDLSYFKDETVDSIVEANFQDYIAKHDDCEAIVVDLNNASDTTKKMCTDIVYLIEAGIIQLNRLLEEDKLIFEKLTKHKQKLVINRSILNLRDIEDFERETGCKVFYNLPNIDDKLDSIKQIKGFLLSLGFTRFNNGQSNSIFNIFK